MKILSKQRLTAAFSNNVYSELTRLSKNLGDEFTWFKDVVSDRRWAVNIFENIDSSSYTFSATVLSLLTADNLNDLKKKIRQFAKTDSHNPYKIRIAIAFLPYRKVVCWDASYNETLSKLSTIKKYDPSSLVAVVIYSEDFSDASSGKDYLAYSKENNTVAIEQVKSTPESLREYFLQNNNLIQYDSYADTVFKLDRKYDPSGKAKELLDQLEEQGLLGSYVVGLLFGSKSQNARKKVDNMFYEIDIEGLPVYGSSTSFITKWLSKTYDGAFSVLSTTDRRKLANNINKQNISK